MNIPLWSKAKLGIKLSFIAFVPFLLTSICILCALIVLSDAYSEALTQQRARRIVEECESTVDYLILAASRIGAYSRSRDPQDIHSYDEYVQQVLDQVSKLKQDAQSESQEMQEIVAQLDEKTHDVASQAEKMLDRMNNRPHGGFSMIELMRNRSNALAAFTDMKALLDALEKQANEQIGNTSHQRAPLYTLFHDNLPLAVGLSVLASISVALVLSRSIVDRLRLLTDKATRLALLQAPLMPEQGSDEIAETDRVFNRMSLELLEAIKKEQAAIACAADAILSIARDGTITAANEALTTSCGWRPQDLVGGSIFEYVSSDCGQLVQAALNQTSTFSFEGDLRTRDGGLMHCLWSTSFSPNDATTVAIVHDVTARKRAEESARDNEQRTRLLMERMPAGLLLLSEQGEILFANDTAAALTGRSAAALTGQTFTSLLSDSISESPQAFVEFASQQARAFVLSLRAAEAQPPSEDRRVQVGISRFGRQKDQDLYLVVMIDYTERWQFEELKQRLVAMIAHDIATPLMTVQNTLTLAESGMLCSVPDEMQEQLHGAEERSSQILQVFKNIVRFQKLAAGFASMSAAQLPLKDLTAQALEVVAEQAKEKQLQLTASPSGAAAAVGDADKLAVLGATLLQTIVEAVPAGAAIAVSAGSSHGTANWVLRIDADFKLSDRASAYLSDSDLLDGPTADTSDLDLILWRLLLYQCGAHVQSRHESGRWTVELKLPSLEEQPAVLA